MRAPGQRWNRLAATMAVYLRRHWRKALLWRDRLRMSEEAFHLLMAGGIGILGGLTNLFYFAFNQLLEMLLLGSAGDVIEIARGLPPWYRILAPTVGGLTAGLVLHYGLRLLSSPGLTNLLEAVVAGDGRLALRPALVNAFSSLVSISSGASIGREGLITQFSATVASKCGQWAKWPPYRLRLMVACGAAAGIAAAYNAPVAGAVFAAQIVLGSFAMNLFAPLVISSVVAAVFSRTFFGIGQWYRVPEFEFTRLGQLPWFLVLGVLAGVFGAMFMQGLLRGERFCNRLPVPLYLRIGLAGLLVGLIGLVYPEVWGNGFGAINTILSEEVGFRFVLGLFVAKLLATTLSVGAGTVGGVLTPTLFLGAALGSLFDGFLHQAGWTVNLPPATFALAGMAAMLAATTHSPLLAMTMVFELSLNYSLMPALMLACAVSTLVARRLHPDTVYTEPLRRKGLELERESLRLGAATERTVGEVMQEPVPPLYEATPFQEVAQRFLTSTNNFLPVVNDDRKLVGMVALQDLKEHLNAGAELAGVIAADVMRPPPPCLMPSQRLADVFALVLASEFRHIPVVSDPQRRKLIGAVTRAEVLGMLSEALTGRAMTKI